MNRFFCLSRLSHTPRSLSRPTVSKLFLFVLIAGWQGHAKQAGTVEVGPSGALLVKSDDTVEPTAKNRQYFKREIENRYGASISKLKEKLK